MINFEIKYFSIVFLGLFLFQLFSNCTVNTTINGEQTNDELIYFRKHWPYFDAYITYYQDSALQDPSSFSVIYDILEKDPTNPFFIQQVKDNLDHFKIVEPFDNKDSIVLTFGGDVIRSFPKVNICKKLGVSNDFADYRLGWYIFADGGIHKQGYELFKNDISELLPKRRIEPIHMDYQTLSIGKQVLIRVKKIAEDSVIIDLPCTECENDRSWEIHTSFFTNVKELPDSSYCYLVRKGYDLRALCESINQKLIPFSAH